MSSPARALFAPRPVAPRRKLIDERNRLGFCALMAYWAGYMFYSHFEINVLGMPLPVFTGLLYATAVTLTTIATTRFLPRARVLAEAMAISRFALAFYVVLFPVSGMNLVAHPLMNATLIILGGMAVHAGLYGRRSEDGTCLRTRFTEWLDGRDVTLRTNADSGPALLTATVRRETRRR